MACLILHSVDPPPNSQEWNATPFLPEHIAKDLLISLEFRMGRELLLKKNGKSLVSTYLRKYRRSLRNAIFPVTPFC